MSLSKRILMELPALRRLARALTGSQATGDAYVEAVLSNVVAMPELIAAGGELRLTLYKLLIASIRALDPADRSPPPMDRTTRVAHGRLMELPQRSRTAFLLKALEGLSAAQIAAVLDCPPMQAQTLVEEGSREISNQLKTDILIIEDEPFIALDLESIVTELGHRVTDVARTHQEALRLIARRKPGLILSDIKLADDSSGLEAVNEILKTHSVPVIFVTAFPERFLTGQKPEPAFLVTKPFTPESFQEAIGAHVS